MTYSDFLSAKTHEGADHGFDPVWMPDILFPFQRSLVEWSVRKGRAAIFADCVAGETEVQTASGVVPISEFNGGQVLTLAGEREATPAWVNGYGDLYRVETAGGKTILASLGHRFMTSDGWKKLGALRIGERLLVSDVCHPLSTEAPDRSARAEDDRRCERTTEDSRCDCSSGIRPCGAQPPPRLGSGPGVAPSQAYARARSLCLWPKGGPGQACIRSHRDQCNARQPMPDSLRVSGSGYEVAEEFQAASSTPKPLSSCGQWRGQYRASAFQSPQGRGCVESSVRQTSEVFRFAYWDSITAIRYERQDLFWDLHVPGPENYLANGVWSHNCGLGKTFCQLTWAENVARKTGGRVLILTPLAVAFQTVQEGLKCGVEVEHRREGIRAGDRIVVTNYERLHHFQPEDFAGVVCDECFAPDTLVEVLEDGACKAKEIRYIRPGESIINASGIDTVSECHRRKITRAFAVSFAGRRIIASENHPWLTQRGWVPTRKLRKTDRLLETATAMRMVRGDVCAEDRANGQSAVLREVLLSEMADEATGDCCQSAFQRGARTDREEGVEVAKNDGGRQGAGAQVRSYQADAMCGNAGEGEPHIESDEAQTFRAWRKREGIDCAAIAALGGVTEWVGERVCLITWSKGSRLSDLLQTGPCESADEDGHRSGRSKSPFEEGVGCKEGCETGFIRLDGIEALERGHPDLERFANSDGDIYFYDIGLTRHPSFTVNGALVHNSSILKHYTGATQKNVTRFLCKMPYRLLCTATAAPNDYIELGTSSEAIGELSNSDMLTRFFRYCDDKRQKMETRQQANEEKANEYYGKLSYRVAQSIGQWRLKHHAVRSFWRWVCSWARACRMPSDLGFDDNGFILPPLTERQHVIIPDTPPEGFLFCMPAFGLGEEREERKRTLKTRAEFVAQLANHGDPVVIWCHTNDEGDLIERIIPGARQVAGRTPDDEKEEIYRDFASGALRCLVIKPKIGAWGLNWQHCANVITFASHSYEQYYQSVRRCWRFGQKREVRVDIIATEGERRVIDNMQRKVKQADAMFKMLVGEMNQSETVKTVNRHTTTQENPSWL